MYVAHLLHCCIILLYVIPEHSYAFSHLDTLPNNEEEEMTIHEWL
jgi:hypothetical protein